MQNNESSIHHNAVELQSTTNYNKDHLERRLKFRETFLSFLCNCILLHKEMTECMEKYHILSKPAKSDFDDQGLACAKQRLNERGSGMVQW